MSGIYKYLIGGKRTGKRNIPTFNELCVGDAFYIYEYKKFYGRKPNEYIRRCKIETIHADAQNSMICFKFCGWNKQDHTQYSQYALQVWIPLREGIKTFHKNIDMSGAKIYFATTEDELKECIKSPNIKITDN